MIKWFSLESELEAESSCGFVGLFVLRCGFDCNKNLIR